MLLTAMAATETSPLRCRLPVQVSPALVVVTTMTVEVAAAAVDVDVVIVDGTCAGSSGFEGREEVLGGGIVRLRIRIRGGRVSSV
jgi:hypothetical protein